MSIDIVIPAFGNQGHLSRALATLEPQRADFNRCIVVDDGSPEPLKAPAWATIHRIERDPVHRGSSAAKNAGAAMSDSTYLCFADSDILHAPDALRSLRNAMDAWEAEGQPDVLLNVTRYGLPRNYPSRQYDHTLDALRAANLLKDEALEIGSVTWEQNCGMLRRDFFNRIGRYDEASFPYWGFNNQDLCLRVAQAGGHVSSYIKRVSTGLRLFCFHIWHENGVDIAKARGEFIAKWGEEWHDSVYHRILNERRTDVRSAVS